MTAQFERDRLNNAVNDAVGRVVARIEAHDDAFTLSGQQQQVGWLIRECRELKDAYDARAKAK